MGPGDLSAALAPLERRSDPRILVGRETFDDAGVFRLSDDVALVQTVDFFAPIVDDPYDFGRVAAANALSDVYAMGGEPLSALNIVAFPVDRLPLDVLTSILRGGQDAVHEAGAHIIGGHTVADDELKYGLAVTGTVHPKRMLTNAAARPGDVLVLTKALGTGILATAAKKGALAAADLAALIASMKALNAAASRGALEVGARCATDVSGFGLLGHLSHVARASDVTLRLRAASLPLLPGVMEAFAGGALTGGADRNAAFVTPLVDWGASSDFHRALLVDPQTSGGLLVAIPSDQVEKYLSLVPDASVIGDVLQRGTKALVIT